jgi:hypothetical protein
VLLPSLLLAGRRPERGGAGSSSVVAPGSAASLRTSSAIRATPQVLVVGCIHGNECAGIAILDRPRHLGPLAGVDLWSCRTNPIGGCGDAGQRAEST